jgi:hypothetical protein
MTGGQRIHDPVPYASLPPAKSARMTQNGRSYRTERFSTATLVEQFGT